MVAIIWELAIFGRHCRDMALVNRWTTHGVLISLASLHYEALLIKTALQDYVHGTIKYKKITIYYLLTLNLLVDTHHHHQTSIGHCQARWHNAI